MLDESLIGLMIDDRLDNYNDYYKCKLMEIVVNMKQLNLMVIRICGILIIYCKV